MKTNILYTLAVMVLLCYSKPDFISDDPTINLVEGWIYIIIWFYVCIMCIIDILLWVDE
jgi:hypothetical protein